jgi:hypothetical protein
MGPEWAQVGSGDERSLASSDATRLSRRQVLQRGAVALGLVAGLDFLDPGSVFGSATGAPRPIPGGLSLTTGTFVPSGADLHFFSPGIGFEMSTITDFNGVIGGSQTRGTANSGAYSFDCDMRFMRGVYVGLDGRLHHGSFGFI